MRINGHPKEQNSFARVSGYVEQFDTHSAAATVHEALMFSGTLRNEKDIDKETTEAFVDQVGIQLHKYCLLTVFVEPKHTFVYLACQRSSTFHFDQQPEHSWARPAIALL